MIKNNDDDEIPQYIQNNEDDKKELKYEELF